MAPVTGVDAAYARGSRTEEAEATEEAAVAPEMRSIFGEAALLVAMALTASWLRG